MKVISIESKRRGKKISCPLPNGEVFHAYEEDMHSFFEDPTILGDTEREGLLQLAIAIVFADHRNKAASLGR